MLTSWAVGIFVSGLVLRNGLGAENLAWTIMFLFMPLTCVYYPVTMLPTWLQPVAWALPPTYVFEGMRALLIDQAFRADLMLEALALNAVLFAGGVVRLPQAAAERPPRTARCCRPANKPATPAVPASRGVCSAVSRDVNELRKNYDIAMLTR